MHLTHRQYLAGLAGAFLSMFPADILGNIIYGVAAMRDLENLKTWIFSLSMTTIGWGLGIIYVTEKKP